MFRKITLDVENSFEDLLRACELEKTGKGRLGANIVKCDESKIPIVRTTTSYDKPYQTFGPLHEEIISSIQKNMKSKCDFNNAMVEVYDNDCTSMSYHTDQSLDLENDSMIAIYSCYKNPENSIRKLIVRNKKDEFQEEMSYDMTHNSVILFSTNTNAEHLHKIILDGKNNRENGNEWIGITFRKSKTFISHDDFPHFEDGRELRLATELERKEMCRLKGKENRYTKFEYPNINYTISRQDLCGVRGEPEYVVDDQ